MKYTFGLLFLFFVFHKTIDAHNPWWRLIIFPILFIIIHFRDHFNREMISLLTKKKFFLMIKIIFFILLSFRLGKSVYNIYRPLKGIEDIAVVHKQAVDFLFIKKENPYKKILFEQAPIIIEKKGKKETYSGFIYTPLGIIYYAPFILWLGRKGMYAGNFLAYWGIFILLMLAIKNANSSRLYLGGVLFLAVDYVFTKAFNRGTNDFMPAFLMLGSLLYASRSTSLAGFLLGLSLGFKQYPGAILSLIFLGQRKFKLLFIAVIIFFIALLPFILNDFTSLYRQIFEVFIYAPMGKTILHDVPKNIVWLIPMMAVGSIFYMINKYRTKENWISILLPFLVFIIFTKSSFTTYFICIFPISILWFLDIPYDIKKRENIKI